jgi:primosomal protein N'
LREWRGLFSAHQDQKTVLDLADYRHQIVLSSATAEPIQQLLAEVRTSGGLERADRIAVDVDPVSLL